ncbi:MAG: DUF3330 domain-containing protein [Gallionella sp.]|jgi:hypothetical protein
MVKQYDSSEDEKVSCAICRKEIPLNEAVIPEAADYMAHFCGLECYAEWKRESDSSRQRNDKAGK